MTIADVVEALNELKVGVTEQKALMTLICERIARIEERNTQRDKFALIVRSWTMVSVSAVVSAIVAKYTKGL